MCCILCIYMTDLTSFFLFHFIFDLLSTSMVMINIAKIESINATENFLTPELFLIYPILIWSRSRGLDVIWRNLLYNILS